MNDASPQRPILRYHGGKWLLAPWIISHFAKHRVYCEPFGGAASVLMQKPRSYGEVYNERDGEIVNLFRVVRERGQGFPVIRFKDAYETECSLQQSSIADYEAIWLGVSAVQPKILASKARNFGVDTDETTGCVPFPIPDEVMLGSRMHLRRDQVEALVEALQGWLKKGML